MDDLLVDILKTNSQIYYNFYIFSSLFKKYSASIINSWLFELNDKKINVIVEVVKG